MGEKDDLQKDAQNDSIDDSVQSASVGALDLATALKAIAELKAALGSFAQAAPPTITMPNWMLIVAEFCRGGLFFILLGAGLLGWAYNLVFSGHPPFVFIVALLGLSIVLFGTGTQSIGDAAYASPDKQLTVKGAIAGGASVLALIFGFGAVIFRDDLPKVFDERGGYGLIVFKLQQAHEFDISKATIVATTPDERKLFYKIDQRANAIQVIVPLRKGNNDVSACLAVRKWDHTPIIEDNDKCSSITMNSVKEVRDGEYFIARHEKVLETKRGLAVLEVNDSKPVAGAPISSEARLHVPPDGRLQTGLVFQ